MQRLRVMRVITRMDVGGPARQVTGLLRGLDPERFDQRLYAGEPDPEQGDYRRLRGSDVPVHPVPGLGGLHPGDNLRALTALVAEIREFRPHVVHTHCTQAGMLGRVAAAACRVPVRVHTYHGHLLRGYFPPARTRMLARAERALAGISDALVAVGARVRDELLAARIGRPEQYVVVPPGASLPPPPPRDVARWTLGLTDPGPVVAYVGQVTAVRRPDRWLAVARRIQTALPRARFVVCGEGDGLGPMAAEAAAAGLGITFLPWRADVETVYAAADLVLLTSDNEGMPVCLIEAALAGRPAVAADVGGVAEVIRDGETGLLAGRDADELAGAVLRLLRDDALCRRMGRAALAGAGRRFATPRLVADTIDLYQRLVALRSGRIPPVVPPRVAIGAGEIAAAFAGIPGAGETGIRPGAGLPAANVLVNKGGGRR